MIGGSWLTHGQQRGVFRLLHGTKDQRQQNFRVGLEGGAGACFEELSSIS